MVLSEPCKIGNMGGMFKCLPCEVLPSGEDEFPKEQDLELPTARR